MKIGIFLLACAFLPQQQPFSSFTYCREFSQGIYEEQCVDLKADGTGQSRIKRREFDETSTDFALSPPGRDKFLSVIAGTQNLANRQNYESKKKVANLGRKRMVLQLSSETREAAFNYSELKEVNALTLFFDGLLNQLVFSADLQTAAQYERLSIPERLGDLQNELRFGRIGDPPGLIPVLDKLIQDTRILEYARDT